MVFEEVGLSYFFFIESRGWLFKLDCLNILELGIGFLKSGF